ncbi:MAG TPA: carbohydrate binding domain-containing protein, partial [Pyrinomonadaceae bacterium]|nr:carbohydrate binding domain-containing protein [Pyrinomonadaceae bacterium]
MKTKVRRISFMLVLALFQVQVAFAQTRNITVRVNKPGAQIPKTLFGLFFEDINFGADGGLYPERIKNRSFEFPNPMMGWKPLDPRDTTGQLQIFDQGSINDTPNSHYLRIKATAGNKGFGVVNEGFRGIGVQQDTEYRFSVKARRIDGSPAALRVEVVDGGRVLGETQVTGFTNLWKTYTATLRTNATSNKAQLNLILQGGGTVDVDLVSL